MSAGTVYENIFQKRKIRSFFRLWANVYFQRKFLPELRKPQSMYRWKFLGKNNFWNIYNLSHFFRTLIQKTLSRKENFFPGCDNCNPRVQRLFLRKSTIFKKKFCLFICFGVWAIFLYTDKKQSGCQRNNLIIQKKVGRKKWWINCFFLKHFWISSRKFWTIRQKILAGLSNSIQSVQRNNFRTFLWNEEILLEVFGRWAKLLNFWCEFWVKIPKTVAYGCSGTFWGSFGEKSISLIVFGLRAKVTIFWQKN